MDIHCKHCGEPWDHDELHYVEGKTYKQAGKLFAQYGCGAFDEHPEPCRNTPICEPDMLKMIGIAQDLSPHPEEWAGTDEIIFMLELADDMF